MYTHVPWYHFWDPCSGLMGGFLMGGVITIVAFLVLPWLFKGLGWYLDNVVFKEKDKTDKK